MIKNYSFAVILSFMFSSICAFAGEKSSPAKSAKLIKPSIPVVTNFVEAAKKKQDKQQKRISTRALVEELQTQDVAVIIATVRQIGKQDKGSRYVLKEFDRLLNSKYPTVRSEVLDAAFSFDVLKPLLPALTKCLNDPVEDIRQDAADIIGDIESREMIGVFVSALTNQYPDVRENAEFYLLFWTDEEFTNAAKWATWWDKKKNTFVFD